jgi:hypothetical protein
MKFQPGDLVAFINEKQSGKVSKSLTGGMVLVAIEDGFEIPVRESELVLIKRIETASESEKADTTAVHTDALSNCEPGNACLAAVPSGVGAVLTGPVTFLLINRTGHEVVFTFHTKTPYGWKGVQLGVCSDQSVTELFKSERDDLKEVRSVFLQIILFRKDVMSQHDIIRRELPLLLPDLRSANKDVTGPFSYARSIGLIATEAPAENKLKNLRDKFSGNPVTGKLMSQKRTVTQKDLSGRGIIETEREVDLHIEELVPELEGLSNSEMLRIQLRYFSEAMDAAIRDHLRKIVFIHGVGSGTLKSEIRRELANYPGISFRDADASRYGRGATEVILVHY